MSAPVAPFTCGATVWYEKTFGLRVVGGLLGLLGGCGPGGFGDKSGVAEDCVELEEVFSGEPSEAGLELLLGLDDGELTDGVLDGVLAPCTVEERPPVEPDLVVDVWARTGVKGEKLKARRMMTETVLDNCLRREEKIVIGMTL
jgi:hypothetical protein